jgi:dCMP deaminase
MNNRGSYFMSIARAVQAGANCKGRKVGAIIVVDGRLVSSGFNGTPSGMTNCEDGGCDRCSDRDKYPKGTNYDLCVCVHAEQNALLSAAKHGIAVDGGVIYSTMRPCFGCTKELVQAGIVKVFYAEGWRYPNAKVQDAYEKLQNRIPQGLKQVKEG